MENLRFKTFVCGVLALTLGLPVAVSDPAVKKSSGAWGNSGTYENLRRKGSQARVRGNVLSTEDFTPEPGMEPGVQLKLATAGGDLLVHVGPRWFVLENDLNFTRGEPLTIIGVKINFEKKAAVIADEIIQGDKKINLRDLAGTK